MQVVITREAEGDLAAILNYLSQDSTTHAARTVERLERTSLALADGALRYALVVGHEDSGVRRRVVGSYNIYYRIMKYSVEVLHFLHGARDHEKILFPED